MQPGALKSSVLDVGTMPFGILEAAGCALVARLVQTQRIAALGIA